MCAPAAGNHTQARAFDNVPTFVVQSAFLCGGQDQRGPPNPEAPAPEEGKEDAPAWIGASRLPARQGTVQQQMLPEVRPGTCLCSQSTKSRAPPAAGAWKCGKGLAFALGSTQNALGHNFEGKCNSQLMQI